MRVPSLVFLLAVPALLPAQDLSLGLATGLSLPVGDLKNERPTGTNALFGGHVAGQLSWDLHNDQALRAHLTYTRFPGSRWSHGPKNDYDLLQAGADWVFDLPARAWYAFGGVSLASTRLDTDGGSNTESGNLGLRGGVGYRFHRNFALEAVLNEVDTGQTLGHATWVNVSATWRFGR